RRNRPASLADFSECSGFTGWAAFLAGFAQEQPGDNSATRAGKWQNGRAPAQARPALALAPLSVLPTPAKAAKWVPPTHANLCHRAAPWRNWSRGPNACE